MRNICIRSTDFCSESDNFVGMEKVKAVLNLENSFALTHTPDS